MITTSRIISDKKYVVSCAVALKPQADWLLELLEKIEQTRGSGFLEDGATVQVGWSFVAIHRDGDTMKILEPNFSGDPFNELTENLTCTLSVQAEQNAVLAAFGLNGTPVGFQDKVILSKGCLEKRHIYLERKTPQKGDSGWYIGEVDQPQEELQAVYVYQLLRMRPALLKVLALPAGYVVVVDSSRVEAILNEQNIPVELCRCNCPAILFLKK